MQIILDLDAAASSEYGQTLNTPEKVRQVLDSVCRSPAVAAPTLERRQALWLLNNAKIQVRG